MSDIQKLLADRIKQKVRAFREGDVWIAGRFKEIKALSTDSRGELGEDFLAELFEQLGHEVTQTKVTDRTQKHWDILLDGRLKLEVKTATLGKEGRMFQHENIERDRNFDILVLLDIAPDAIYLTLAPKKTLPFNERNSNWTKNPKKMHRRATGIHYKWDLSLRDVEDRKVESLDDLKRLMPKPD